MSDILIRDLSEDIVFKIDELSKKSGAKSRNDFLKRQLELMSSLEELKRIEGNYSYLIKKLDLCQYLGHKNSNLLKLHSKP
ncbi:hypothetical protein [Clostridium perfringens]|uniref:hypothetical protein n=1 Tax=Clostridium perfringens TaxID=1502 RepID=UPI0024BC1429|nr:hypothetical protein [Clostridium perfringens]